MSVIRKLSKAIHNFPNGERRSSPESSSPAGSPRDSSSSSPRQSPLAAIFRDKEYAVSSDELSDSDSDARISKNAQKRQSRKKERKSRSQISIEKQEQSEERMKTRLEEASKHEIDEMKKRYGELPLVQSTERSGENRISFDDISSDMVGKEIVFRARIHHVRRMGPKLVFFVFRQSITTIQGVLNEVPGVVSIVMLHWAEHVQRGSIVRIKGVLQKPEAPVKSTTMHDIEVKVTEMKLIVRRADPSK